MGVAGNPGRAANAADESEDTDRVQPVLTLSEGATAVG
jgi:hypothetical protein